MDDQVIIEEQITSEDVIETSVNKSKKKFIIITISALLLLGIIGGIGYYVYVKKLNYEPRTVEVSKDINIFKYEGLISDFDDKGGQIKINVENSMAEEKELNSMSDYDLAYEDQYELIDKFIDDTTEIKKLMDKVESDLKITREEYIEVDERIDSFYSDWEDYR